MAERYLIASGPVSNSANWFGGNKPTVGDVAHANGFTGTIDEDISATTWTTAAGATAVAGGGFSSTGVFTLTGNLVAGTTPVLTTTLPQSSLFTILGSVTGGDATGAIAVIQSGGNLSVSGNATGGSAATTRAIRNQTTHDSFTTVGGHAVGGTGSGGVAVELSNTTTITRQLTIGGNAIANVERAVSIVGVGAINMIIGGNAIASDNNDAVQVFGVNKTVLVYGSLVGALNGIGMGVIIRSTAANLAFRVLGSVVGRAGQGILLEAGATGNVTISGGVNGGSAEGIRNPSAVNITVLGASVGGHQPAAHGILNESTGTVRVGGQSITNPSGALGVSNPGNGPLEIGYLVVAYFADVSAGENNKALVVLLKNAVNCHSLVTGSPTIDILDFARDSVIGGPQAMTLDDDVYSYEHGSTMILRNKLYYARVAAVIDGEARDLAERPFRT